MSNPEQTQFDQDYRDRAAFEEAEEGRRRDDRVREASGGPEDPDAMAAADDLTVTDREASAYREHTERGAHQQGEGAPNF